MIFIADLTACSTCFGNLCPSSGALEYYTSGCYLWYLVLWFSSCRYGVELRVVCPVCGQAAPNKTGSNHLYITLELLMMGIIVPETCWASNKICNKNRLLHLVDILFPHTTFSVSTNQLSENFPDFPQLEGKCKGLVKLFRKCWYVVTFVPRPFCYVKINCTVPYSRECT